MKIYLYSKTALVIVDKRSSAVRPKLKPTELFKRQINVVWPGKIISADKHVMNCFFFGHHPTGSNVIENSSANI